jgi:hypothetical protein
MPSREVEEAAKALLDPFTEPEPSQETGPGTHFRSTFAPATPEPSAHSKQAHNSSQSRGPRSSKNPFRHSPSASRDSKASSVVQTSELGYLTPPQSATLPPSYPATTPPSNNSERLSPGGNSPVHSRARSTSLQERYPGDSSHAPLAIIRKESKRAQRSPHLRRKHQPGADTIDRLDLAGLSLYHHEGPYDAASRARNSHPGTSPLAATQRLNEEALKATPRENVYDSVKRHRPLDGVAIVPPGQTDRFGRRYDYEEGANLQIEGQYKRWPGVDYKDEDLKGKGEPSYSIEKALKDHKMDRKNAESEGIELQPRRRRRSVEDRSSTIPQSREQDVRRTSSMSKPAEGIKKRFGSLRRRRV